MTSPSSPRLTTQDGVNNNNNNSSSGGSLMTTNSAMGINPSQLPIPDWFNDPAPPLSSLQDNNGSTTITTNPFPLLVIPEHQHHHHPTIIPSPNLGTPSSTLLPLTTTTTTTTTTNATTGATSQPLPSVQLGKDADLSHVRSEVCSLMTEVTSLMAETETVFTEIENIYFSRVSPMMIKNRLSSLSERYHKLMNTLRISGLGALPTESNQVDDIESLLDSLQAGFHDLYRERQIRREGSAIVLGVLQSVPSEST